MEIQNVEDFAYKVIKGTNVPLSFALFVLSKDNENASIYENDKIKSKKLKVDENTFSIFETTIKNFKITKIEYTEFYDDIDCCSSFVNKNLKSCYEDLNKMCSIDFVDLIEKNKEKESNKMYILSYNPWDDAMINLYVSKSKEKLWELAKQDFMSCIMEKYDSDRDIVPEYEDFEKGILKYDNIDGKVCYYINEIPNADEEN